MPTKHVDRLIEAYLDSRLSSEAHQHVETHLRDCPTCTRRLGDAKHLSRELGPLLQAALGWPTPQAALRQQIRGVLKTQQTVRPLNFIWTIPAQFLNATGTATLILLLVLGLFTVLQNQLSKAHPVGNITTSRNNEKILVTTTATPTPPSPVETSSSPRNGFSLGDTLPTPTPHLLISSTVTRSVTAVLPAPVLPEANDLPVVNEKVTVDPPGGTIAFALFNPAPDRQLYEIHFINPDGTNHHKFSLDGVSEPALSPTNSSHSLVFRAWAGPTSPRSLLSGDFPNQQFNSITNFWEDAQPDWSPTENRIIFASQRESDRRWRLYSVWGDGSFEVNLRREGKSPTFAPDGYRFAFESCDKSGNQCGLWMGDLEHSEYASKPFLPNPSAKSPDWSPGAEEIAYMANPDGNWDLYLVNSDGRNVRRLTDEPAIDGLPVWSPDGEWLAFVSNQGGNWGIWLVHIRTGNLRSTITFERGTLTPPNRLPYNQHGERHWWDEQLSWGP
jgi:hypothetical protein